MLEFCVWEGKGTNPADKFKRLRKNIENHCFKGAPTARLSGSPRSLTGGAARPAGHHHRDHATFSTLTLSYYR